jgi:DNA-binding IclR family transcriptional regulator
MQLFIVDTRLILVGYLTFILFTIVNTLLNMYRAPTVQKVFRILELIAKRDKLLTISDLSRELDISKSTVHGITRALESAGAVVRDSKTKRYTLGMTLFDLTRAGHAHIDLKNLARPVIEDLMKSTQQSVFLGIRSGDHVSIIDIVESTQDLKITAPVGTRVPLLAGAIGKAFLAAMDENRADALIRTIGLREFTDKSIIDFSRYKKEVSEARSSGYGLDDEEYIPGVRAVAAVIQSPPEPMSAVWVVGFTPSMGAERMFDIAMETKRAAKAISQKIAVRPSHGQGK